MRGPQICLALICCLCLPALSGNAQSAPPANPPKTSLQENLSWLPGLGQGTVAPRYATPHPSVPIHGAMPIPRQDPAALQPRQNYGQVPQSERVFNNQSALDNQEVLNNQEVLILNNQEVPRSVLTDIRTMGLEIPTSATGQVNTGSQARVASDYPVVPATLITAGDNPVTETGPDNSTQESSRNSNVQTQNPGDQTQTADARTQTANQEGEVVDARITTVTRGMQQLPNDAGQIWRTYDISPYTYSVQANTAPEQAVVDWILKETGTEVWFTQPMGILNATRDRLHVYHTPAMHDRIKPIVDRLVYNRGRAQVVGLKMVTIASPDWRSSAFSMMKPIPATSDGVEAWLITKENAAILSGLLRNRADYQEQSNGDLVVSDGQKYKLARTRPVDFIRSVQLRTDGYARYESITDRIDEGYSVDFSALTSLDGKSIEAIVGCNINQIEKMQRVTIELPTASGQPQPVDLQIPQMVSWKVTERFRWPSDMVLVLSCGVVATPGPQRQALMGIPSLFNGNKRRADALMFIEYKGPARTAPNPGQTNTAAGQGMIPVVPRR